MTGVIRDENGFTVPAEVIATAFGLTEREMAERMRKGEITSRTEAGIGDDAGRWRLSFSYAGRTFRLTVDAAGTILSRARFDSALPNFLNDL
ncbi:DUF6522 family protein [Acidimangrovimonas pyrenivorans]|uniref:DUF6522 family protein n=1 Tax=Acidimangrovimonas pyrenivorans TaxID=2030798 RepID=A0ABV7AG99_9RHOB